MSCHELLTDKDIIDLMGEIGRLRGQIKGIKCIRERILEMALKNLKLRNCAITGQPRIVSTKGLKFNNNCTDNYVNIPDDEFDSAILLRQQFKKVPTFKVTNDMTCFISVQGNNPQDLINQLEQTIICIKAGLKVGENK